MFNSYTLFIPGRKKYPFCPFYFTQITPWDLIKENVHKRPLAIITRLLKRILKYKTLHLDESETSYILTDISKQYINPSHTEEHAQHIFLEEDAEYVPAAALLIYFPFADLSPAHIVLCCCRRNERGECGSTAYSLLYYCKYIIPIFKMSFSSLNASDLLNSDYLWNQMISSMDITVLSRC